MIMLRAVLPLITGLGAAAAADKPNIIFILDDDMGWPDLGCYGSEIGTPHIDSLAKVGLRCTQFHDLAMNANESHNLAQSEPEKLAALMEKWDTWMKAK